jgi:cobalt-zinc-cadmium efflux system outer membrane protein
MRISPKKMMLWATLGIFVAGSAAFAETPAPSIVDLETLTTRAIQKSPSIQAKKAEYEALKAKVMVSWLPPDPEAGVDVEGQPDLFKFGERMDNQYMLSQTIPFPTKLVLRGALAAKEADIAYQKYQEEVRETVWHIEQPYYELVMLTSTIQALQENQSLLEQLERSARTRYESGQAPQSDVLKSQIELNKNAIELFNTKEKKHLAQAHLAHILNEPLMNAYEAGPARQRPVFSYTLEDLEKTALEKRSELKALRIGVEKSKVRRLAAQTEWFPDITLRYEGRKFKGEDDIRENDTFLGVTVPVWSLLQGIGGGWRSAGEDVRVAEAIYQEMKNETLLKVHEAYSKLKSAGHALDLYENSILPQSKQQADVALSSYEAGKVDFLTLVDAQKTLRESRIASYEYFVQYETALAELRLAVGDDLKPVEGSSHEETK